MFCKFLWYYFEALSWVFFVSKNQSSKALFLFEIKLLYELFLIGWSSLLLLFPLKWSHETITTFLPPWMEFYIKKLKCGTLPFDFSVENRKNRLAITVRNYHTIEQRLTWFNLLHFFVNNVYKYIKASISNTKMKRSFFQKCW